MKKQLAAVLIAVALVAAWVPAFPGGETRVTASADEVQRALDYLGGRQQADGGFAEPGQSSSDTLTAWVVSAIAAAGEDPGSWRRSGNSPIDYLSSGAGSLSNLTDLERSCLAVCSAGGDPRAFGGRNLVAGITGQIGNDGHLGTMINEHCWGLIALAAAGETVPESCRSWLTSKQNIDGGFGFNEGSASDPDDTGAALQALMATGESADSSTVSRALTYLQFCHSSDGGFYWQTTTSNVASTAWAVQGISATGEDPDSASWSKSGKTPLDFLKRQQQSDGHIKYSADSDSHPAWMTAESIPALLKKPYPLNFTPPTPGDDSAKDSSDTASTTTTTDTGESVPVLEGEPEEAAVSPDALGEEGAPDEDGESGRQRSPGSNDSRDSGSPDDGDGVLAMSAADGGSSPGGGGNAGGGVPLFLVICGIYLAVLGVVSLVLKLA